MAVILGPTESTGWVSKNVQGYEKAQETHVLTNAI